MELIVPFGTGGDTDQLSRVLGSIIESSGISPQPFLITNMPGGGGLNAARYLAESAGNDHKLMVLTHNNLFFPNGFENSGLGGVADLTAIAIVAIDPVVLVRRSDQFRGDGIDALKSELQGGGEEMSLGIGSLRDEFAFASTHLGMVQGMDFREVFFDGNASAVAAMLSGDVDFALTFLSQIGPVVESGDAGIEVVFGAQSAEGLSSMPAADLDLGWFAMIVGPPNMTGSAAEYYSQLFTSSSTSSAWQEFCTSSGLSCRTDVSSESAKKFLDDRDFILTNGPETCTQSACATGYECCDGKCKKSCN